MGETVMEVKLKLKVQHAMLVEALESFARMPFDFEHREAAAEALRQLLQDVGMNFGYEEALMLDGHYAEFEHHRRQHVGLMTELGQLLDRVVVMNDPKGVARNVDFLLDWYRQHTEQTDAAFERWLDSGAMSPPSAA